MFKICNFIHRNRVHGIISAIIPFCNQEIRKFSVKRVLYNFQKNFSRGKHRNSKAFKVSFVSGSNIIAMYRFGTSSNKTILKILCLFLECNENIIVRNAAHLDNFQKFSDCLICQFCAMSVFSHKIEDIGNRRY